MQNGLALPFRYFFLLLSFCLAACGGGDSAPTSVSPQDPVAVSLSLERTQLSMIVGEQTPLQVVVHYSDGAQQEVNAEEVEWRCDEELIAINPLNQLTALAPGTSNCIVAWDVLTLAVDIVITPARVVQGIQISPQGPMTLALSEQQSLTLTALYSDGSSEAANGGMWICDSDVVSVNNQQLVANALGQAVCRVYWQAFNAELNIEVVAAFPEPRNMPLSFLDHIRLGEQDAQAFYAWGERAVAGNPGWGFSATDAVYMYYLKGDTKYIDLAIEMIESMVTAEEAAIAACVESKDYDNPYAACPDLRASFNSYLRISDVLVPLAYTYDYGYDFLSDSQKQRWQDYANQAVWNIWNHDDAQWGGVPYRWSGWAVGSPGNNYYYSFLLATTAWAIADDNATWMDLVRDEKLPLASNYYADFEGGGSREGTSYGSAQRNLFEVYRIWKEATGEDIAAQLPHVRQTIDYWIHATTPTLDLMVPYGDQSRVAYPVLYDYQEAVVRSAVALNLGTEEAKRGRWWLDNNSVTVSKGNTYSTLYAEEAVSTAPSDLLYHAKGAGQLFIRSSWETDATWLALVSGIRDESHSHQDQGSFTLFKHDWLAVTENIWTRTGIHQGTDVHNILRFVQAGSTVPQQRPIETSMSYQQQGDTSTVNMELAAAYQVPDIIQNWQRQITFTEQELRIKDQCEVADDVDAIWQVNLPTLPEVQSDGSIKSGQLVITVVKPLAPEIAIIDWSALDADAYKNGGYKLEIKGDNCQYELVLSIID